MVQCNKNLGPALIEREQYIRLVQRDHLNDRHTYLRLNKNEANAFSDKTIKLVNRWIRKYKEQTTLMERRFIRASIVNNTNPLPKFYATIKVHKMPLKTRPIVSVSGTLLQNIGVWVDRKLQLFLPLFNSYFKSSTKLKRELTDLVLPPTAKLFTADAVSMYTSIPTNIALVKIICFLCQHKRHHNERHPYSAIIEGLGMVMQRCAFTFGNTYWLQKTGMAMGLPPAPAYATLYFGLHKQRFLRKHKLSLFLPPLHQ